MKLSTKIKIMLDAAKKNNHIISVLNDPKFQYERINAEVLRNVHSVEKGLSLKNVRSSFGYEKIKYAANLCESLILSQNEEYLETVKMFISALSAYLTYHDELNIVNEKITEINEIYKKLSSAFPDNVEHLSGYLNLHKKHYTDEEHRIMKELFYDRHSVREFSGTPVAIQDIYEAIELACRCPSACNRQGYRVHIVCKEKMMVLNDWFEGIGGFENEIDKMLLITGKISTYRQSEEMQYIVSASVFAGFLTLALQEKEIGCCFIQRPVVHTSIWENVSKNLSIPEDEQIICALGIGTLLEEYKAPVSHRLSLDTIVSLHE